MTFLATAVRGFSRIFASKELNSLWVQLCSNASFVYSVQLAACGCAGIFTAPIALSLYLKAFEEVSDRAKGCSINAQFGVSAIWKILCWNDLSLCFGRAGFARCAEHGVSRLH